MAGLRNRIVLTVGALAAVTTITAGVVVLWPDEPKAAENPQIPTITNTGPSASSTGPSAGAVADEFLAAVQNGKGAEAGALTDDPAAATAAIDALTTNTAGVTKAMSRQQSGDTTAKVTTLSLAYKARWTLTSTGNKAWTYDGKVDLVKAGDRWQVHWTPAVIHPDLAAGQNLAVLGQAGRSGQPAVLDKDGKAVAVWEGSTAKATDPKIAPLLVPGIVKSVQTPGDSRYIAIVDTAGKEVKPVFGTPPAAELTEPVKTTLSSAVSVAAQDAVAKVTLPTMLVAVQPSTGGILAVAQNSAAGTTPHALNGGYAPGSTFKVITAAAALQRAGLAPDSEVQCPGQGTYGGRAIKNAGFDAGPTTLRTAFAKSCNTTFADIAAKLPADGLSTAAGQFGLNADFDVPGATTELGKVEPSASPVQRVEDSIGQGRVTASPLGMAMVTATVAAGRAITPKLLAGADTTVTSGYQAPPKAVTSALQAMMTEVVNSGTATALKGTRVAGKTGTAETRDDGSKAHGWFIGYRGDMAFAALVVDAGSSASALDVSKAFLSAVK